MFAMSDKQENGTQMQANKQATIAAATSCKGQHCGTLKICHLDSFGSIEQLVSNKRSKCEVILHNYMQDNAGHISVP